MAHRNIFTNDELRQIDAHGLTAEEVFRQLDVFKMSATNLKLVRPCTRGDGIRVIERQELPKLMEIYENEILKRNCLKFVPASGAATRMFKALLVELNKKREFTPSWMPFFLHEFSSFKC